MFEQMCLLGIINAAPAIIAPHEQKLSRWWQTTEIALIRAK
ncbi:hypothetical protein JOC34_001343 [Virgibacillus halotolerans]|nr:hypothetical protein [Virgibacillus halotolerans]